MLNLAFKIVLLAMLVNALAVLNVEFPAQLELMTEEMSSFFILLASMMLYSLLELNASDPSESMLKLLLKMLVRVVAFPLATTFDF